MDDNKISRYKHLQETIKNNSQHIDIKNIDYKSEKILYLGTNLKSRVIQSKTRMFSDNLSLNNDMLNNEPVKTIKYKLFPTEQQKIILHKWFAAYIEMYNSIIQKIRTAFVLLVKQNPKAKLTDLKIDLNISKLKKEFAANKSSLNKKYDVNMHILDYAINDAISAFKSKRTNLRKHNIQKSRLRYLKQNKNTKIFKVEKYLCNKDSFCSSVLGSKLKTIPSINFEQETEIVGIVQYNKKKDEYYYLVRKRIYDETVIDKQIYDIQMKSYNNILATSNTYLSLMKNTKNASIDPIKQSSKKFNTIKRKLNDNRNSNNEKTYVMKKSANKNIVSIDPGIRTFLTCLSNDHIKEIGLNMSDKIKSRIIRMDKISEISKLNKNRKDKILSRLRLNVKNLVDDYHWKIVNHLTNNYKHVIIGNFSTKDMCEGLQLRMTKRTGSQMRFYVFKQRLQYKCYLSGVKYTEIDEYCTSKCCSVCGYFKKNLGPSKIYACDKCDQIIDRDLNASKNILLKSISLL